MRKSVVTAVAIGASAALVGGMTLSTAEARTKKELNICWASDDPAPTVALPAVADGPSYRATDLTAGNCKAWDVRPGNYKFTVRNANAWLTEISTACNGLAGRETEELTIRVKRAGQEYRDYSFNTFLHGDIVTNVKKDRRTTIAAHLRCVAP
jgi:hypothetical protein